MTTTTCRVCNGSGTVLSGIGRFRGPSICGACRGTGRIPGPVTEADRRALADIDRRGAPLSATNQMVIGAGMAHLIRR